MSINSKTRRDAKKKKQRKPGPVRAASQVEPHAHLLDGDGNVFGGAGWRGNEWVMVMGSQVVAGTDSAGMILGMLKHVASLREAEGLAVQLNYSTKLRDAATKEAEAEGLTLDAYLASLEEERVEHAESKQVGLALPPA